MDPRNPLLSPLPVLRLGATAPNRAQPRVTAPNRVYSAECRYPLEDSTCPFTDDKSLKDCRMKFNNVANFDFTQEPCVPPPETVLHFTITVADAERFWAARPHLKAALETVTREIRSGNSRLL